MRGTAISQAKGRRAHTGRKELRAVNVTANPESGILPSVWIDSYTQGFIFIFLWVQILKKLRPIITLLPRLAWDLFCSPSLSWTCCGLLASASWCGDAQVVPQWPVIFGPLVIWESPKIPVLSCSPPNILMKSSCSLTRWIHIIWIPMLLALQSW